MLLNKSIYNDNLSKIKYNLKSDIKSCKNNIIQIKGENGVGKTRFIEGVLLKELKKNNKRILYFGQDIENQILSFNLITLVKSFVDSLKKQGSFFKTVFLNDDSHTSIKLDFDEETTLNPDDMAKRDFIIHESGKYFNLDVVIFDEADKYFHSSSEFIEFIKSIDADTVFVISHIIDTNFSTLMLTKSLEGVNIEFINI